MVSQKKGHSEYGFTLIELLVVIVIIALLLSIVVPTLTRVKERARLTICQSNIRSFHIAVVTYASGNDDFLPQGGDVVGVGENDYIFIMSQEIHESLVDNAHLSLVCPNLFKPYKGGAVGPFKDSGYIEEIGGYLIGYNYLGGFPDTPWDVIEPAEEEWISLQKMTDNPRAPIITELNTWVTSRSITFAPHGYWGPIHESKDSTNIIHNGAPSDELGAIGGHIGALDGAIEWKDIEDMKIHKASSGFYQSFAYW